MQKLRKGLSFMINRKSALAFATWLYTIERASQQAASAGDVSCAEPHDQPRDVSWLVGVAPDVWVELKRRMESMRRSMGHFLNRELSRGWGAWVEMAVERATFMQKLRKGLSFMINRQARSGLWHLAQSVFGVSTIRCLVRCAYMNRNLARGWVAWIELWAEKKRKMESMRRSMGHFLNRELSRGWGAWVEMAIERATFMQKLRKGLSFMINRKLAVGFASWRMNALGRPARGCDPMAKALSYFMNRELARGWMCWVTTWEEVRRKMIALRRGLVISSTASSRAAGVAWVEMAVERAAFMQKLRKGLSFMINRKSALAFATWLAIERAWRLASDDQDVEGAEPHDQPRAVSRLVAWHADVGGAQGAAGVDARSLGHILNRELSRGWGAWVEMAIERAEFMQKLRKGLSLHDEPQARVGFATWREASRNGRSDGEGAAHLLNRELSRGWRHGTRRGRRRRRSGVDAQEPRPHAEPRAVARLGRVGRDGDRARGVHAEAAQGLSIMVNRKLAVGFATWRRGDWPLRDDPMAKALSTS